MAVQPLQKAKIIKKIKNHPNRFQSDRFMRVDVSVLLAQSGLSVLYEAERTRIVNWIEQVCLRFFFLVFRNPGESLEVLIAPYAEDSRVPSVCPRSVVSKPKPPDTCYPVDSGSFRSETRKTLNCCSWTTVLTAEKLLNALAVKPEKPSSREPKNSTLDSPTEKPRWRRFPTNEQSQVDDLQAYSQLSFWRAVPRAKTKACQQF